MSLKEYDEMVNDLKFNFNLFIQLSKEAANGTKKLALECRKQATQLNKDLKEFRILSIKNDKQK